MTPIEALVLLDELCSGWVSPSRAIEIQALLRSAGAAHPRGDVGLQEEMLALRSGSALTEDWRPE